MHGTAPFDTSMSHDYVVLSISECCDYVSTFHFLIRVTANIPL